MDTWARKRKTYKKREREKTVKLKVVFCGTQDTACYNHYTEIRLQLGPECVSCVLQRVSTEKTFLPFCDLLHQSLPPAIFNVLVFAVHTLQQSSLLSILLWTVGRPISSHFSYKSYFQYAFLIIIVFEIKCLTSFDVRYFQSFICWGFSFALTKGKYKYECRYMSPVGLGAFIQERKPVSTSSVW